VVRQVTVAEVYELMDKLAELVFNSPSANARQASAQILVSFFVHYPLSAKRLRQHLDVIVGNLAFEVEDGRLAGLGMLRAVVDKFPQEVLEEEVAGYCFFPLVLRLVNDDSHKCKALVGSVIKRLLARIGPKAANQLIGCVKGWLDADGLPLIRMLVAPKRRRISSSSSSSS
jgi:U3 small nucleolar RNA-associated protein 20